jgi:hypothetical protein
METEFVVARYAQGAVSRSDTHTISGNQTLGHVRVNQTDSSPWCAPPPLAHVSIVDW